MLEEDIKQEKEVVEEIKKEETTEEIKNDTPSEDTVSNDEKVDENQEDNTSQQDVKIIEKASLENVEEARKKLYAQYKKNKMISNILMAIVVVIVIICFILVAQKEMWMKIVGYCLGGAAIVAIIIYYFFIRNKFPNATREYIEYVNQQLNGYCFESNDFSKALYDPLEKIDQSEVMSDRVYENVIRTGSRNVVVGVYKDKRFKVSDMAAYVPGEKNRPNAAFVGKYLITSNTLKFDGRFIINFKGLKPVDLPSDISDLTILEQEESYTIYGPEGADYKKILTPKFLSKLKNIKIEDDLLNVNVGVWGGHTAVYLSYTDAVISLPFQEPFKKSATQQYRNNLIDILETCLIINK